jgi:hypothetical protein
VTVQEGHTVWRGCFVAQGEGEKGEEGEDMRRKERRKQKQKMGRKKEDEMTEMSIASHIAHPTCS